MSSFLNVIDGVIETFGRILIMTANDIHPLKGVASNALLRPGRIDRIIHLDRFNEPEVLQMLDHFYRPDEPIDPDHFRMKEPISPAELTKLFQSHPMPDQLPLVMDQLSASSSSADSLSAITTRENAMKSLARKRTIVDRKKDALVRAKRTLTETTRHKHRSAKFLETADNKIAEIKERIERAKVGVEEAKKRLREKEKQTKQKAPRTRGSDSPELPPHVRRRRRR